MSHPALDSRYARQIKLREIGEQGQQRLSEASVLVIGAGGLGCPALQYLAAAGVGSIGIADHDTVAVHNLHRQILYATADVGQPKTEAAARYLARLNPEIKISLYRTRITNDNALEIIRGFDYIIDGSDNFETRYLVNDACVILGRPMVYGAIGGFEGQLAVFNHQGKDTENPVNYRDLFPTPPAYGEVRNCEEAGVIGVLPGIIGMMMASETIKLIAGYGDPLINTLLIYNLLDNQTYSIQITKTASSNHAMPKDEAAFRNTDYGTWCNMPPDTRVEEIDAHTFKAYLSHENVDIVDVRETSETPTVTEFKHIRIPLADLEDNYDALGNDRIILFCQSGKRSHYAAQLLSEHFKSRKKIYSLKGGILAWKDYQSTFDE